MSSDFIRAFHGQKQTDRQIMISSPQFLDKIMFELLVSSCLQNLCRQAWVPCFVLVGSGIEPQTLPLEQIDRQKETDRKRQTERQTETDRQRDRKTDTHTDRHTHTHTQTHTHPQTQRYRHTDTDSHTNTHRESDHRHT